MAIAIGIGDSFVFTYYKGEYEPLSPSNLTAVQDGDDVDLAWTDNATNELGYKIYRSSDGVTFVEIDDIAAGSTSYTDVSVTPGFWYYYVAAYNAFGEGDSNIVFIIVYILHDTFVTPEAAPIVLPRNCEPVGVLDGVQTRTFTILDGYLRANSGGTGGWSLQTLFSAAQTRAYGLVFSWREWITASTIQSLTGWQSDTGLTRIYSVFHPANLSFWHAHSSDGVFIQIPDTFVVETWYEWQVVLRSTGAFYYLRGGVYSAWQQVWVNPNNTTATLYVVADKFSLETNRLDDFKLTQLPEPFTADANIATQLIATVVSGTTYDGVADGISDLTMTAPNPLSTICELRFRVQDESNYWTVYADTDGSIKVDSVNGGTPTNRLNVAGVFAAAALRIVRIRTHGSKINVYTRTSATGNWTKRGNEINVSYLDGLTDVTPVAGAGWALGALQIWDRHPAPDAKSILDSLANGELPTYDGGEGWFVE